MATDARSEPRPDTAGHHDGGIVTTVVNQKGGTGKTTLAANCAAAEAIEEATQQGVDPASLHNAVLVIDMDDQCDLTRGLGLKPNTDSNVNRKLDAAQHGSIALMLDPDIDPHDTIKRTRYGVDVIPGHPELLRLDASLAGEIGAHEILARHVRTLRKQYRRIIIDCPGLLGISTVNALVAADELLVPVCPGTFELAGLVRLAATVEKAAVAYKVEHLQIDFIVVTDFDKRETIARDTLARLHERYPHATMNTVVPRAVRIREAPGYGEPLCVFDPGGPADRAFRAVVAEMRQRRAARG